jgi:hypothetical protein
VFNSCNNCLLTLRNDDAKGIKWPSGEFMMKAILLIVMLFLTASCGYEKEKIGEAPATPVPQTDRISGPQRVVDNSTEIRLGANHPLIKKDIFALMNLFFSTFVESAQNVDGTVKDSGINFDGMYLLRLQRDLDFLKLVSAIETKLSDPAILNQRSVAFKLAFYLNAYNYFAVRVINKNYLWSGKRINSILDLGKKNEGIDIFKEQLFFLEGERLSLNEIAKNKIGKLTNDADGRIPFALHCVAKGCPFLPPESFKPETIEMQLDSLANANLLLARNFRVEVDSDVSMINQLFNWYQEIFIKDPNGGVSGFIKKHLPDGQRIYEEIEYISHDWSLNKTEEFPIKVPEIRGLDDLPGVRPIVTDGGGDDDDDDDDCDEGEDCDDDRPILMKECEKYLTSPMMDIIARCMEVIDTNINGAKMTIIGADICLMEQELVEQEGHIHTIAGKITERKKNKPDSTAVEKSILISSKSKKSPQGFGLISKNEYKNIVDFSSENLTLHLNQRVKVLGLNHRNVKLQCFGFLK